MQLAVERKMTNYVMFLLSSFIFHSSSIICFAMKKYFQLIILVLVLQVGYGQTKSLTMAGMSRTLQPAKPESVGMSTERLARIDSNVNRWMADGRLNGCVALIVRHGKIVYQKAFGYDDPEH